MFRVVIKSLLVSSLTASLLIPVTTDMEPIVNYAEPIAIVEMVDEKEQEVIVEEVLVETVAQPEEPELLGVMEVVEEILEVIEEPQYTLTDEEINLIALVTMAEAEGESEYGKRLVIDTILNRADHDYWYWPDTVTDVIYQEGQFEAMWNGRVDDCYVREDIVQLVKEELENRTNSEVLYFRTKRYSDYGTPSFKEGNHYFSNY